jgi:SOS response regulatory protein OraA/RecX
MKEKTCYNKAIDLLSRRAHSVKGLKTKLTRNYDFDSEEIKLTIEKLIDRKYLDDENYKQLFIRSMIRRKKGPRYIIEKARLEGIQITETEVLLEDEENQLDLDGMLKNSILNKYGQLKQRPKFQENPHQLKDKLLRQFISKGHSFDKVLKIINNLNQAE